MDNLPSQPTPSPITSPISSPTPSEKNLPKNILKIMGVLLIIGAIVIILIYFNILPISNNQTQPSTSTTQATSIEALAFVCPVEKDFCSLGKQFTYRGNYALGYNLASGSSVLAIANVSESRETLGPDVKGIKHTFEFVDSCYTLTYTLADDATMQTDQPQPLIKNTPIAKAGSKKMTIGDQTMNLIVQMQSVPMAEIQQTEGMPKCSSLNPDLRAKDFGKYLDLSVDLFSGS